MSKPIIAYDPTTRTLQPSVTGSIIVGLCYNEGVLLASDTMGSYGGLRRFKDVQRVIKVNENCMLAASGDIADFMELERLVTELVREDEVAAEQNVTLNARSMHAWLQTVMYHRRSKMNPFWLTVAVAGWDKKANKPFLGVVDQLGVSYEAPHITTGFGGYIAGPFMELKKPGSSENLTRAEAEKIMKQALSVVNYRDKMTINSWTIGNVGKNEEASLIAVGEELPTNWKLAHMIVGYE